MPVLSPAEGRPFTRTQHRQNDRFLEALRRTGNARLAARMLGVHRATYTKRRARNPAFAQAWDAALTIAQATLQNPPRNGEGDRSPKASGGGVAALYPRSKKERVRAETRRRGEAGDAPPPNLTESHSENERRATPAHQQQPPLECTAANAPRGPSAPPRARANKNLLECPDPRSRTKGGEPVIVRRANGRLQIRLARPGRMTDATHHAFLAALSATANVRLSAAAAGVRHPSLYALRRRDPAFAREWRLALQTGYERLEAALIASALPGAYRHDDWRRNDPPAIPPMSASQALQLLYLHQKEARLGGTPEPLRRRRGESPEAMSTRLRLIYEARLQRDREAYLIAEAERGAAANEPPPPPPALPDLAQVTGWSKADVTKTSHDADLALFGGWRIGRLT